MQAVTLGPLVFAADRLAVITGVFVFLTCSSVAARRLAPSLARWSSWAAVMAFIGTRLWHVAAHAGNFADDPLRAVSFWQGGFAWEGALVGGALASLWLLRGGRALAGAALCLATGLFAWHLTEQLVGAEFGQPAPKHALHTLDGAPVTLQTFQGKPVVVNLWASWCPPCRREMPMMAEVARRHPDVHFVFINSGEGLPAIRRYLALQSFDLPNVLQDPGQSVTRHYDMPGLPVTLFLGTDGRLRSARVGEISRETLEAAIGRLGTASQGAE